MDEDKRNRKLIATGGLIVAYALSRLDRRLLRHRKWKTWQDAFTDIGKKLNINPNSVSNLRDEFDPFFDNGRKGWTNREIRPSRQRILGEFMDVSDAALFEIVHGILAGDDETNNELVLPLTRKSRTSNAAEILRTGRAAEAVFMRRSEEIVGVAPSLIVDYRDAACGFDFGTTHVQECVFEVKGLRSTSGDIRFTDLEWRTAKTRGREYVVIVIGDVFKAPVWKTIASPTDVLSARSTASRAVAVHWHASVKVA